MLIFSCVLRFAFWIIKLLYNLDLLLELELFMEQLSLDVAECDGIELVGDEHDVR
jgi:hypothetical protein